MSEPTPSRSAPPGSGPAVPTPPPKPRNPAERIIVWGLIIAMLALVSVEAYSKFSYDATVPKVDDAMRKAEMEGKSLTVDELKKLIAGMPSEKNEEGTRIYRWWSLFKTYELTASISDLGRDGGLVVTSISTPNAEEDEPVRGGDDDVDDSEGDGPPPEYAGMSAGGGGFPGGGHGGDSPQGGAGGFPPLQFAELDANEDGSVTIDELPPPLQGRFAQIDADGDGAISEQELDDRPRREAGPENNGEASRPELESENEGDDSESNEDEAEESEVDQADTEEEETEAADSESQDATGEEPADDESEAEESEPEATESDADDVEPAPQADETSDAPADDPEDVEEDDAVEEDVSEEDQ